MVIQLLTVAVVVGSLVLFSLITAYVMRFGVKGSGIHADYMLYVVYLVVALVLGGAI